MWSVLEALVATRKRFFKPCVGHLSSIFSGRFVLLFCYLCWLINKLIWFDHVHCGQEKVIPFHSIRMVLCCRWISVPNNADIWWQQLFKVVVLYCADWKCLTSQCDNKILVSLTVKDSCKWCCRSENDVNKTCKPYRPTVNLPDGMPCLLGSCNKAQLFYLVNSLNLIDSDCMLADC